MCPGASKPVHHNRWACTVKPTSCNHWSPRTSEPTLCSERSHLSEKPGHEEEQPRSPQLEKSPHSNEDSAVKIQRQWLKLTSSLLTAFLKNHWDSVLNISRLVVFFFSIMSRHNPSQTTILNVLTFPLGVLWNQMRAADASKITQLILTKCPRCARHWSRLWGRGSKACPCRTDVQGQMG